MSCHIIFCLAFVSLYYCFFVFFVLKATDENENIHVNPFYFIWRHPVSDYALAILFSLLEGEEVENKLLVYPYYIVAFAVTYKNLKYLINQFFVLIAPHFYEWVFRELFVNVRELLPSLLISATCVLHVLHNGQ